MSFEKHGRGIFCLFALSRRAQLVAAKSGLVNFGQIFKSAQIWGPRQRLVKTAMSKTDGCWNISVADEFWETRPGKLFFVWPVPTRTASCSKIGSRKCWSNFQICTNLRSPTAFGKNGYVQAGRMMEYFCCGWVLRNAAGETFFCLPCPDAHSKLRGNRVSTAFGQKTAMSKVDGCWNISGLVIFCQISKSAQIWSPRQRLVKNGYVQDGRMLEYFCCRLVLRNAAGETFFCLPSPDAHSKLQLRRLSSIFVRFSNLTKFEVPASVWSNFFVVRTNFFAVRPTFLLSVLLECRNAISHFPTFCASQSLFLRLS